MSRDPVSRWLLFLTLVWLPTRPRELRRAHPCLMPNPKEDSRP
jgi:hypothetical protein